MSAGIIATAVRHLMAAGVTGEALLAAIADLESSLPGCLDEAAERRRARDREYQANRRRQKSAESADSADTGFPDKETPQTPQQITPSNPPLKGSPPKPKKDALAVPADIPAELWEEFEQMRRDKKKPLSDFSRKQLWGKLRNIAAAGWNVEDVMTKAIIGRHDGFWMPDGKDSNIRRANDPAAETRWTPERMAEYRRDLERREATSPPGQPISSIVGKVVNQARAGAGE